ncbi:MAG: phasin family protein, partial [Paucimonas sp.]|nr:phasin family protein [Paucimonas sp.]
MFNVQDQISVATRSSIEAQAGLLSSMATKTFESLERLTILNLNAAKASLEESSATLRQVLAAKDPQEVMSLTASQAQPTLEKALSYGRHVANIASSAQIELTKAAESQAADVGRKFSKLVDDTAKVAPPGSENLITLVKASIETSNAGFEQWSRMTQQAIEAM